MNSSLTSAIMNDDVQMVIKMLDSDPMLVNAPGHGDRPIHVAAANNREKIIKELIIRGADIDAVDDDGKTALHRAAELAVEAARVLLENSANANLTDKWGCTPLALAYAGQALEGEEIAQMLLEHGTSLDLSAAAAVGDLQAMKSILEENPQSVKTARSAERLLGLVVSTQLYGRQEDRAEIASLLLENGLGLDQQHLERIAEFAAATGSEVISAAIRAQIENAPR